MSGITTRDGYRLATADQMAAAALGAIDLSEYLLPPNNAPAMSEPPANVCSLWDEKTKRTGMPGPDNHLVFPQLANLDGWRSFEGEPHCLEGPTLEIAGAWFYLEAHEVEVFEDGSMRLMKQANDVEGWVPYDMVLKGFEEQMESAVETVLFRGKRWVIWAQPAAAMSK